MYTRNKKYKTKGDIDMKEIEQFKLITTTIKEHAYSFTRFEYYRDIFTDVMYVHFSRSTSDAKCGLSFTPILGADGKPMLYDEWCELTGFSEY